MRGLEKTGHGVIRPARVLPEKKSMFFAKQKLSLQIRFTSFLGKNHIFMREETKNLDVIRRGDSNKLQRGMGSSLPGILQGPQFFF